MFLICLQKLRQPVNRLRVAVYREDTVIRSFGTDETIQLIPHKNHNHLAVNCRPMAGSLLWMFGLNMCIVKHSIPCVPVYYHLAADARKSVLSPVNGGSIKFTEPRLCLGKQ